MLCDHVYLIADSSRPGAQRYLPAAYMIYPSVTYSLSGNRYRLRVLSLPSCRSTAKRGHSHGALGHWCLRWKQGWCGLNMSTCDQVELIIIPQVMMALLQIAAAYMALSPADALVYHTVSADSEEVVSEALKLLEEVYKGESLGTLFVVRSRSRIMLASIQ